MTWTNSWEISKLEMLRSFKLCVLFVNNRSTISLFYDGSVDLISFVRDRTTFHDESWEFASWVYRSPQWSQGLNKVKNHHNNLIILVLWVWRLAKQSTLEYLIDVGVRLLNFWQSSSQYVLIPYPTFINFTDNVHPIRLFCSFF